MYNWVSSAYCCSHTVLRDNISNRRDIEADLTGWDRERIPAWGTPVGQSVTVGESLPTQTLWVLSNKYEVSHANGEPVMPNLVCNMFKRILWSMVSNAALKSKDTNIVHLPLSEDRYNVVQRLTRSRLTRVHLSISCMTEARCNREN